jgi:hypothetical protein
MRRSMRKCPFYPFYFGNGIDHRIVISCKPSSHSGIDFCLTLVQFRHAIRLSPTCSSIIRETTTLFPIAPTRSKCIVRDNIGAIYSSPASCMVCISNKDSALRAPRVPRRSWPNNPRHCNTRFGLRLSALELYRLDLIQQFLCLFRRSPPLANAPQSPTCNSHIGLGVGMHS